jgi:hypothetical protein
MGYIEPIGSVEISLTKYASDKQIDRLWKVVEEILDGIDVNVEDLLGTRVSPLGGLIYDGELVVKIIKDLYNKEK